MENHAATRRRCRLALLPIMLMAAACGPRLSAQQTADAWTGHPLSELKQEWEVIGYESDSGRIFEIPFGQNAESGTNSWTEVRPVSATQMIQEQRSEDYYIPRRVDCELFFKVNEAGTIVGNELRGTRCDYYVSGYGPPPAP